MNAKDSAASSSSSMPQSMNLSGSAETVSEFLHFAVNSILYQRGVYPPESFKRLPKYGLTMHRTTDDTLLGYMERVEQQLRQWLQSGQASRVVLVLMGLTSGRPLERWVFNCHSESDHNNSVTLKPTKDVSAEISAILRQITSAMTFLPALIEPCSFDILIYASESAPVSEPWEPCDPCYVDKAEHVKLRSFSTNAHEVSGRVFFKTDHSS